MIQLLFIIVLLGVILQFWPVLLIGGLLYLLFRSWKNYVAPDPHIGYVIIKDKLGKFGITRKNKRKAISAVKQRYSYQPLEILWTGEFRDRKAAFNFERYCKSQVRHIVRGREWISVEEAHKLVRTLRF